MFHLGVIGCGSIGERHLRTFLATGRTTAIACDPRAVIRERMAALYGVEAVGDWQEVLAQPKLDAAVIAAPAPVHVPLATRFLRAGRHVLIEKPLAVSLEGIDTLLQARDASRRFAAVGYVYHSFPALVNARNLIRGKDFGALRHVVVASGQHFPTFRPAYREIYYGDHAQGGGAIQDALTHLVNAVEWVAGPTTRVFCEADHQVLEGVTVEDTVAVSARNGDIICSYTLNQFQAPNETLLDFHAERGSVRVEVHAQRWATLARGENVWSWHDARLPDRDAWFVAQANAFLDGCAGHPTSLCTLEEGIQTLRFNLAALESARTNCSVSLIPA